MQTLHLLYSMDNILDAPLLVSCWNIDVPQDLFLVRARHVQERFNQVSVYEVRRRGSSTSVGERPPFLVTEASDSLDDFGHRSLKLVQKPVVLLRQSQDCADHPIDCPKQKRLPFHERVVHPTCAVCFRGLQTEGEGKSRHRQHTDQQRRNAYHIPNVRRLCSSCSHFKQTVQPTVL